VDYNIAQIKQYPAGISAAFDMKRNYVVTLQLIPNLLPDGFDLPWIIPAADNKIVSKRANLLGIQKNYVISLFIRSRLNRQPRYIY
jgi:hypothetical protein